MIDAVSADPSAVSGLTTRNAELADLLANAQLEPRLMVAANQLRLTALSRPNRPSMGG